MRKFEANKNLTTQYGEQVNQGNTFTIFNDVHDHLQKTIGYEVKNEKTGKIHYMSVEECKYVSGKEYF